MLDSLLSEDPPPAVVPFSLPPAHLCAGEWFTKSVCPLLILTDGSDDPRLTGTRDLNFEIPTSPMAASFCTGDTGRFGIIFRFGFVGEQLATRLKLNMGCHCSVQSHHK